MKRLAAVVLGLLVVVPSLLYLGPIRKVTLPEARLHNMPRFEAIYFTSLDYRYLLSELLVNDAVFYYGGLISQKRHEGDYRMMLHYLDTATRLNPYNIDAYYFGQAILTWDAGMVKEMNWLLQRGVKKRTWDFYLPFFVGFNYSYFLNDNVTAAEYTALAAKLNPQAEYLTTLASRQYYEANKTDQAIAYLKAVLSTSNKEMLRRSIMTRIAALEVISLLEHAVEKYEAATGHPPRKIADLVDQGILRAVPPDPYGGQFYLDDQGRVKTTSKLSSTRSKE